VNGSSRVSGITSLIPSPFSWSVLDQELTGSRLRILVRVKDPQSNPRNKGNQDQEEHGADLPGMDISTTVTVFTGLFAPFR